MKRTAGGVEFTDRALQMLALVFTIGSGLFSFGVSTAAARFALAGKADGSEVAALRARFAVDSVDRSHRRYERDEQLIELNSQVLTVGAQVKALEARITQLACYKNPNPACR